jgi:dsRNA-specific ribonuclease
MVTEASALEALQQRLQHRFMDARLLHQALNPRSPSSPHPP